MRGLTSKILRAVAMVASTAALMGMALPSSAAIFRSRWDPVFNTSFSPLVAWSGSASIEVDNACVSPGNTVDFAAAGPCQGLATLLGYGYSFYEEPDIESPFASGGGAGPGLGDPTAVRFGLSGIANGMDLTGPLAISFYLLPGTFSAYGHDAGFFAEISFTIGGGPVLTLTEDAVEGNTYVSGECQSEGGVPFDCTPKVFWTPEPGSWALAGLALLSLVAVRRRPLPLSRQPNPGC